MTSLRDALTNNASTADDAPAVGITVADIKKWREQERELLIGMVKDRIALSETRTLLAQSEARCEEMAVTAAANARSILQLEYYLREASS